MAERRSKQDGSDIRASSDQLLIEALSPTIQHALRRSLRDDRSAWAEALYPIVLPSIRMAVSSALREAVASLNQLLETSFSLRAWKWRVEAWRTGKRFAEVVLLRTLVYRVEQVLLVYRANGLLLQSMAANAAATNDVDLVSGMLVAVQEFVRNSFHAGEGSGLHELRMTDLTVWIEQGPWAVIAAVIRGHPPADLRATLTAAIDLVHQEMQEELRQFDGDAGRFAKARPILEGCLQAGYQKPARTSHRQLWAVILVFLSAVALWAGLAIRDEFRWRSFVDRLNTVPGIVVTSHYGRAGQKIVEGFRDPLTTDPVTLMKESRIDPDRVALRLRPFISLEPGLALARAAAWLQPPASVSLRLQGATLTAAGSAPRSWVHRARAANLAAFGIRNIQLDGLEDLDFIALRKAIESEEIRFEPGIGWPAGKEMGRVAKLAAMLTEWISVAREYGRSPRIQVTGRSDRRGTSEQNQRISEERASRVKEILVSRGVPEGLIDAAGEGDAAARSALPGADDASFRTATIRLHSGMTPP